MMNVHPTIIPGMKGRPGKEETADVLTDTNGVIVYCNDMFARLIGRHVTAIVHTQLIQLFQTASEYEAVRDAVLGAGAALESMSVLHIPGQRRVLTLVRTSKVVRQSTECLLWQFSDVSDNRETARKLISARKEVQRLNSQIERFLYSTSHDLRAPLTTILGLVNLMRLDQHSSDLQDWMSKIESSALRLEKIIADIASFSRTTYQPLETTAIHFKQLVVNILKGFKSHSNFSALKIEIYIDEMLIVKSDGNRLRTVLECLIQNAFDYVDNSKSAPYLRISARKSGAITEIEILENGVGIAKEYQNKIFELFYKASTNSKGAGLGLFMAGEALSQISGTIRLESEIGFGTAVHVSIPDIAAIALTPINFHPSMHG